MEKLIFEYTVVLCWCFFFSPIQFIQHYYIWLRDQNLCFTSSVWTKFRSPLFYSVSSSFNFFLQMNEINDFSGRFSFLRGEFEQLKTTLKTRYFALLIVSMTALGDITHLKIFLSSWEQWENTICSKFLSRFFWALRTYLIWCNPEDVVVNSSFFPTRSTTSLRRRNKRIDLFAHLIKAIFPAVVYTGCRRSR